MTVTEALWKEKAVVASNVGGIPLQITDGQSGYLVAPEDKKGFVDRVVEIMKNEKLAKKLGENGREKVRKKFLITRALIDYLDILNTQLRNNY